MKAFDTLAAIPSSEASDKLLAKLKLNYAPFWFSVLTIYNEQIKAK